MLIMDTALSRARWETQQTLCWAVLIEGGAFMGGNCTFISPPDKLAIVINIQAAYNTLALVFGYGLGLLCAMPSTGACSTVPFGFMRST